jgi:hypothetical protein
VKGTDLKSKGPRDTAPIEPRHNTTLAGLMAFGVIDHRGPQKYWLGRKSCIMLAAGATTGGLITVERFFGIEKDGWAIFYDGEVCPGGAEVLARGVREMTGAPAIYRDEVAAATMARVIFKIDRGRNGGTDLRSN